MILKSKQKSVPRVRRAIEKSSSSRAPGRGAPVPGRSNFRTTERLGYFASPLNLLRCCVRGWAHSGRRLILDFVHGAARFLTFPLYHFQWLLCLSLPWSASAQSQSFILPIVRDNAKPPARVVIVHDPAATDTFQPRPEIVLAMVNRGIINFTGKPTPAAAWHSLISTQDIVGIKVYSATDPDTGTRPAVVAAVIEGLLAAKISSSRIIVWDKQIDDLRGAGFFELASRYGIRVASSAAAGYDANTFYNPEKPVVGQLRLGDLEFGRQGEGVGRKSFVSKLVSTGMTKIINIPPLLNHYRAGVSGNLYSLTMGSVDNTFRFEVAPERLATAVPEIYALPALGDRVVLNIVDALLCQYEGEHSIRLHDSVALNELRFSTDPVALDVLSFQELNRQRQAAKLPANTNRFELFPNASELELGVSDPDNIRIERVK